MIYLYPKNVNPNDFPHLICTDLATVCIGLNGKLYLLDECGNWSSLNDKDFIIMQHTGYKDTEGKDIYEGDILQTECGLGIVRFGEYDNHQNGCHVGFHVKFVDNPYVRQDLGWWAKKAKVGGNIWEHYKNIK